MSALSAVSTRSMSALVATLPLTASPMVSTKASASGSAAPASQRALTARCVSKASALMRATVRRRGPGRQWAAGGRDVPTGAGRQGGELPRQTEPRPIRLAVDRSGRSAISGMPFSNRCVSCLEDAAGNPP